MTPDKATVELVAKAWQVVVDWRRENSNVPPMPTAEQAFGLGYQAALAALPTPTDASGLVEGLELIKKDAHYCNNKVNTFGIMVNWMETIEGRATKALAQHREGKQWSDEVPTVPGWYWNLRDGANLDMVLLAHGDLYYYDDIAPGEQYYIGLLSDAKGQWCGPLQPPADKEG